MMNMNFHLASLTESSPSSSNANPKESSTKRKKKSSSNNSKDDEKIVRNKKVEVGYNMKFNEYIIDDPINADNANIEKIYLLAREKLKAEIIEAGVLKQGKIISNDKTSKYAMETDIDQESFDTRILKH